jgi:hypothetical protein
MVLLTKVLASWIRLVDLATVCSGFLLSGSNPGRAGVTLVWQNRRKLGAFKPSLLLTASFPLSELQIA